MNDGEIETAVAEYLRKKGLPGDIALTFDDVTIVDSYSTISSRSDIKNTKGRLAKDIVLNIPIISANMDNVTGYRMAIAMARLGGIGFIPQFASIEERKREIAIVKRADSAIIENPLRVAPDIELGKAKKMMAELGISSALVVDNTSNALIGILSHRDYLFERNNKKKVGDIVKKTGLITAPWGISRKRAIELLCLNKIEKLPLLDRKGRVKGLITTKDLEKRIKFPNALRDKKGRLMVGGTVGVNPKKDIIGEVEELLGAKADVILVDTARGNSELLCSSIRKIRKRFGDDLPLVAGNVDNPEGTLYLIKAGVDCVKVGIGPGSACKTREGPGVGIPQITAIAECCAVASKFDIPIIGDGGIRKSVDFCKALVAGANSVMIGGLFAGTEESPGITIYNRGEKCKMFMGSASIEQQLLGRDIRDDDVSFRTPEGIAKYVKYKGDVSAVIGELIGHLRSSMSYVGARTTDEFRNKKGFRRQTLAGYEEGKPNDVF